MPVDQPGRTQAGRKSRRRTKPRPPTKTKPRPPVRSPAPGTGQGPPRKAGRYVMPGKGMGDTGGGEKSDRTTRRVERFKSTPKYRQTIRDVYDVKSRTTRRTTRSKVRFEGGGRGGLGGPARFEGVTVYRPKVTVTTRRSAAEKRDMLKGTGLEPAILTALHRSRIARNRELERARAQHDIPTDADFARADVFKGRPEFSAALKAAAASRHYKGDEREQAREAERVMAAGIALGEEASREAEAKRKKEPWEKGVQSSALAILENINRPLLGVTGGAYAGLKGRNVLAGAGRGLALKEKRYGSDVLEAAGVENKVVRTLGGFGIDVFADPLSYTGLGVAKPALQAARKAQRESLEQSVKAAQRLNLRPDTQAYRTFMAEAEGKATRKASEVYRAHPLTTREPGDLPPTAHAGPAIRVKAIVPTMKDRGTVPLTRGRVRYPVATRRVSKTFEAPTIAGAMTGKVVGSVKRTRGLEGGRRLFGIKPGGQTDRMAADFIHDWRPRDIDPVLHGKILEIVQTARGTRSMGEREAVQFGQSIERIIADAKIPPSRQEKIAFAIDHPQGKAAKELTPTERNLAERIDQRFKLALEEEQARDIRGAGIGERERPEVPEALVKAEDVDTARKAAQKAARAAVTAERRVVELERRHGGATGRAEILSRNVEGTRRAEGEAAKAGKRERALAEAMARHDTLTAELNRIPDLANVPKRLWNELEAVSNRIQTLGEARVTPAGGGYGIDKATRELAHAKAEAARLRQAAKDVGDKYLETSRAARRDAAEVRKATTAQERFDTGASGYYPRILRTAVDPEHMARRGSTGKRISGVSLHQRTDPRPLEELGEDAHKFVIDDLPAVAAARIAESRRMTNLADTQNRLGALLAKPVRNFAEDVDELGGIGGVQFYERDSKGYRKLFPDDHPVGNLEADVEKAIAAGKQVYLMPSRYYDYAFELMGRGRSGIGEADRPYAQTFDKIQGLIKTVQTVINPGYHTTNLIGDSFNSLLAETRAKDFRAATRLATTAIGMDRAARKGAAFDGRTFQADLREALKRDASEKIANNNSFRALPPEARGHVEFYKGLGREASDAEVVLLAQRHGGIQMGMGGHEIVQLMQTGETWERGRGVGAFARRRMENLRAINERREDFVRLATFRGALKDGKTPEEAARWVNRHHFDYGNLTNAERQVGRRLIPFYTFFARNTRLQADAILRNPGIYSHFQAAREEGERQTSLPEGWDLALRGYEQRGVPMPLPGVTSHGLPVVTNLKLPLTDLNQIPVGVDPKVWAHAAGMDLVGRMTMLAKLPLEQITELNFFFQDAQQGHVTAPSWTRRLPPDLKRILGYRERFNKPTGTYVPVWSWRADAISRSAPILNLLSSYKNQVGRERGVGGAKLPLINFAIGPKSTELDMDEVRVRQLQERNAQLDTDIRDLGSGKRPEDVRKRKRMKKEWNRNLGEIYELDKRRGRKYPRGKKATSKKRRGSGSGVYGKSSGGVYGSASSSVYGAP